MLDSQLKSAKLCCLADDHCLMVGMALAGFTALQSVHHALVPLFECLDGESEHETSAACRLQYSGVYTLVEPAISVCLQIFSGVSNWPVCKYWPAFLQITCSNALWPNSSNTDAMFRI